MGFIFEYHPDTFVVWPSTRIERGEEEITHKPKGLVFTVDFLFWGLAFSTI